MLEICLMWTKKKVKKSVIWKILICHSYSQTVYFNWCVRKALKVLEFSMMCICHRQNSYIIFQCYLPVHQYTSDICQKVLLFQPNRIPGACCRDTTPWLASVHFYRKPRSAKVLLRVSKYVAVAGCHVGWVRWVRQLLNPMSCATRDMWARALSCSNAADLGLAFPFASLSLPGADCQHLNVLESSYCCLLWQVIHQQHTFAISENCGHNLSSQQLSAELPGQRRVDVFPLHRLLFGVWIPVMNPRFIISYY